MPKINQELLQRLSTTRGVSIKRIYKLIEGVANRDLLDRHLAAFKFAAENGVNIQKYSSEEERAKLRVTSSGVTTPRETSTAEAVASASILKGRKAKASGRQQPRDNSIFVVHGRNERLRKSMFEFLRALGLNPLEWGKAVLAAKGANPHIENILDSAMARVQAVVVMFSPDDIAKLKDEFCTTDERRTEGKLQGQPRPNVIFEAGLAYGRHPKKTLLIQVGKVRGFTDIAGKHIVRLSNAPEKRIDVANRLRKIGCAVDTQGTDWTTAGDFTA